VVPCCWALGSLASLHGPPCVAAHKSSCAWLTDSGSAAACCFSEDEEAVIASSPQDAPDALPWVVALKHSEYDVLSMPERLAALLWLIGLVLDGPGRSSRRPGRTSWLTSGSSCRKMPECVRDLQGPARHSTQQLVHVSELRYICAVLGLHMTARSWCFRRWRWHLVWLNGILLVLVMLLSCASMLSSTASTTAACCGLPGRTLSCSDVDGSTAAAAAVSCRYLLLAAGMPQQRALLLL